MSGPRLLLPLAFLSHEPQHRRRWQLQYGLIIKVARILRPGETFLGGEFITAPGGRSTNQAVGAVRAGGRVTFVARVGGDALGLGAQAGVQRTGRGSPRDYSPGHRVCLDQLERRAYDAYLISKG